MEKINNIRNVLSYIRRDGDIKPLLNKVLFWFLVSCMCLFLSVTLSYVKDENDIQALREEIVSTGGEGQNLADFTPMKQYGGYNLEGNAAGNLFQTYPSSVVEGTGFSAFNEKYIYDIENDSVNNSYKIIKKDIVTKNVITEFPLDKPANHISATEGLIFFVKSRLNATDPQGDIICVMDENGNTTEILKDVLGSNISITSLITNGKEIFFTTENKIYTSSLGGKECYLLTTEMSPVEIFNLKGNTLFYHDKKTVMCYHMETDTKEPYITEGDATISSPVMYKSMFLFIDKKSTYSTVYAVHSNKKETIYRGLDVIINEIKGDIIIASRNELYIYNGNTVNKMGSFDDNISAVYSINNVPVIVFENGSRMPYMY